DLRDKTNVGEFRRAVYKDDVRRLYVAVNQTMLMQEVQSGSQLECQIHTFADGQFPACADHVRQCFRGIGFRNDFLTLILVVSEFHDVIEVAAWLVTSNVQYVNETPVRARDGRELLNASELAIKRRRIGECTSVNDLHGLKGSDDVARQPDLPVRPFTN